MATVLAQLLAPVLAAAPAPSPQYVALSLQSNLFFVFHSTDEC